MGGVRMSASLKAKRIRLTNLILKAAALADEIDAKMANGGEIGAHLWILADEVGSDIKEA